MMKTSGIAFLTCVLVACTAPTDIQKPTLEERIPVVKSESEFEVRNEPQALELEDWLLYVGEIEKLIGLELAGERDRVFVQHSDNPTDGSRLALGYLLSRPHVLVRDLDVSRALLAEIDAGSAYAPVRDLLLRELAMIDEIATLQFHTVQLQSQLDALKEIEADLSENQSELDESQR